jgi:hypothetical protein
VELVTISIEHMGITLQRTLEHLTTALPTVRPNVEQARASMGVIDPNTDSNAMSHDYRMFKSLLASLTDSAQSRLLGIVRNKKRLAKTLPRASSRHREHSATPPTYT